jgi:competence protein ComEA
MQFDRRWLIGGAAVAVAAGFMLPRPAGAPHPLAAEATVPPPLLADTHSVPSAGVSADTASSSPSELAVYVCGAVKHAGVYLFAPGARVVDAIKQAGGEAADADMDQINLAEPLRDAMKVTVPHKGQTIAADSPPYAADGAPVHRSRHSRSRGGGRGANKLAPGQTLDVNTASEEQLVQLPGVGPGLARRIVDFRQQNGLFQTIDDLQNVPGIGPSKFDRLAPYVRL